MTAQRRRKPEIPTAAGAMRPTVPMRLTEGDAWLLYEALRDLHQRRARTLNTTPAVMDEMERLRDRAYAAYLEVRTKS